MMCIDNSNITLIHNIRFSDASQGINQPMLVEFLEYIYRNKTLHKVQNIPEIILLNIYDLESDL